MNRWLVAVSLLAALAAGCVNHRKSADQMAKAGNWKGAEAHYREALRKSPDDKELAAKHAEAKQKAFDGAMAQAKGCFDAKNWPCAAGEADYAAGLVPESAEAKTLQANARKGYALDDLAKARTAVNGDQAWGLDMVDHARGLSQDPEVVREIQAVTGELVTGLLAQAAQLRTQAAAAGPGALPIYDRAILLLERGARADMRCNQVLAEVRGERARWVDAEYERLARQGDEALVKQQWQAALQSYQAAEGMRPGGRGKSAAAYAQQMINADTFVARRDWRSAAAAYTTAAAMPEEGITRRFAAAQLERVEVRPYRFRLASILVNPIGPDGRPWTGEAVAVRNMGAPPANSNGGSRGPEYRAQAKGYAQRVPYALKPNLIVDVTLPDGRVLRTGAQKDVWATFDGWFVMDSNHYDQRTVLFQVKHTNAQGQVKDIGTVSAPLGALVSGMQPPPAGPVIWTEVLVDWPRTLADGAFGGFASMVPGRANEATDGSSPSSAAAIGWRLARVEASVRGTDAASGAPDLKLELEQSGRVVYRSPEIKGSADGSWAPENVYVFAAPGEQVIVRLFDVDPGGNRVIYGGAAPAPGDRQTVVEVKTPQGSTARLVFERRTSTP